MCSEQWRPVPGYDGYEVSDQGAVRSWLNPARSRVKFASEPHEVRVQQGRYLTVRLFGVEKPRTWAVHQLVARAFLGEAPEGMEVRHLNGINYDCRLVNLAYGTSRENKRDTEALGRAWYQRPDIAAQRLVKWRRSMAKVAV